MPITAVLAADECLDKTCVDVFTENNQLIITAQKGGNAPKAVVSKKPSAKPKPAASKRVSIKPTPKAVVPKKIATVKPKPKVVASKLASASLSDRLIKLLPTGDINFQPEIDPLVNMPIYFWTKTPTQFTAVVPILDLIVYVNLHSTFIWSYGDGALRATTDQGAPYPIGLNTHTYQKNGEYQVGLKVIWRGTWMVNGVTTPISGDAITQSVTEQVSVVSAVGRFTK